MAFSSLNSNAKLHFAPPKVEPVLLPPDNVTVTSVTTNSATITFTTPDCTFDNYVYYLYSGINKTFDSNVNIFLGYSTQTTSLTQNRTVAEYDNKYYLTDIPINSGNSPSYWFYSRSSYSLNKPISTTVTINDVFPNSTNQNYTYVLDEIKASNNEKYLFAIIRNKDTRYLDSNNNDLYVTSAKGTLTMSSFTRLNARPGNDYIGTQTYNGLIGKDLSVSKDGNCISLVYSPIFNNTTPNILVYTFDRFKTKINFDISANLGISQGSTSSLNGAYGIYPIRSGITYDGDYIYVANGDMVRFVKTVDLRNDPNTVWNSYYVPTTFAASGYYYPTEKIMNLCFNRDASIMYVSFYVAWSYYLYKITGLINDLNDNTLFTYYSFDYFSNTTSSRTIVYSYTGLNRGTMSHANMIVSTDKKFGERSLFLKDVSSQYVTVPSFTIPSTGMSFSVWFKTSSTGIYSRIFDFSTDDNKGTVTGKTAYTVCMYIYNSSIICSIALNGDTNVTYNLTSSAINPTSNTWIHVGWTINPDGTNNLYINGSLNASNSMNYPPVGTVCPYFYIGKSTYTNDPYYNGYIDEFRAYTRILTDTEINRLYVSSENATIKQISITARYADYYRKIQCSADGNLVVASFSAKDMQNGYSNYYNRIYISVDQGNTFTEYYNSNVEVNYVNPVDITYVSDIGNILHYGFGSNGYTLNGERTFEFKRIQNKTGTISNTDTALTLTGLSSNTYYTFAIQTKKGLSNVSYQNIISIKTP